MIAWDVTKTARQNVQRLCHHIGTRVTGIDEMIGTYPGAISNAAEHNFLTANKKKSKAHDTVKHKLATMFDGGIPDDWYGPVRSKQSLYKLMDCHHCRYRMRSQAGCIKFSLTKSDIDNGHFINTNKQGAFRLSEKSLCPYARRTA